MPNAFAYLVLLLWLPATVFALKRYPPTKAAVAVYLGGLMFLPQVAEFKLPGLPELHKEHLIGLYLLAGLFFMHRRVLRERAPGGRLGGPLMAVIVIGWLLTGQTNGDPVRFGPNTRPGLSMYDGLHEALQSLLEFGIPFYLGRVLIRSREDLQLLLKYMAAAGLIYSLFALWEIRMSPQLHADFYGVHPNEFTTVRRYGGWRPLLFMDSGIAVGQFFMMCMLAAAILRKVRISTGKFSSRMVLGYLFVIMVLIKSTAAVIYGVVFFGVMKVFKPKNQGRFAVVVCLVLAAYPLIRVADVFPYEVVLKELYAWNPERAWSMEYRFRNEDNLVDRAMQRPVFGGGTYGRNRIFDMRTGQDISATDGYWIIALGSQGLVGLYACLLLLIYPVFKVGWRISRIGNQEDRTLMAGLCLLVAARAIDLIPNGWYTSFPLFLAGALYSLYPGLLAKEQGPPP